MSFILLLLLLFSHLIEIFGLSSHHFNSYFVKIRKLKLKKWSTIMISICNHDCNGVGTVNLVYSINTVLPAYIHYCSLSKLLRSCVFLTSDLFLTS